MVSTHGKGLARIERVPSLTERVFKELQSAIVAPLLTEDDLRQLRSVSFSVEPPPEGEFEEMFGPDLAFHDFLRSRCPLGFLNALIDTVQVHRSRLVDLEHSASAEYRRTSYDEHRAIYGALARRDGATARRLMQEHLDRIGAAIADLAAERAAR